MEQTKVDGPPDGKDVRAAPDYEQPEAIPLGTVEGLTGFMSSGPHHDGASDASFRWKAG
jgi:hypothetical protein